MQCGGPPRAKEDDVRHDDDGVRRQECATSRVPNRGNGEPGDEAPPVPPLHSSTGRHRLDDACARHGRCGRHGTESAFGGRRFGGGCGIRSFIVRAFTPIAAQAALMNDKKHHQYAGVLSSTRGFSFSKLSVSKLINTSTTNKQQQQQQHPQRVGDVNTYGGCNNVNMPGP